MRFNDLRQFLSTVRRDRELVPVRGASPVLEMAAITDLAYRNGKQPAFLFDRIPGYPNRRALFGLLSSRRRMARALYLPLAESSSAVRLACAWKDRARGLKLVPPVTVESGPVLDNVLVGESVDLTAFPSPTVHELDGGRYLATDHAVITRDPDSGWVNLGTYRCMVLGPGRLAVHLLENQHCRQMYDKYAARKQPMPVALAIGLEPGLHYAAGTRVSDGVSELDYAGGIRGAPVEVILGKLTGLPIPATAEIAIEGMFLPGETAPEGPFGEWHGYYANRGLEPVDEPVIRVKAIYHRNNPILTCSSPGLPPNTNSLIFSLGRASAVWMALDKAGIPGVQGVWAPEELGSLLFTVVSIRQEYEGHSMKAARIASEASRGSARYIVMVDDDIDPSDVTQVMWAVATRTNPEKSFEVLTGCAGSAADPVIPLLDKKSGLPLKTSRAIIDACRPFRDRAHWYPLAAPSRKLEERVRRKWASLFQGLE